MVLDRDLWYKFNVSAGLLSLLGAWCRANFLHAQFRHGSREGLRLRTWTIIVPPCRVHPYFFFSNAVWLAVLLAKQANWAFYFGNGYLNH